MTKAMSDMSRENTLDDIEHNAIMDEFDCLYDREQDMMG